MDRSTAHNPPHIHAICGEDTAAFNIATGELIDGHLPRRAVALVRVWMGLHKEELTSMWETQEFKKIDSLE